MAKNDDSNFFSDTMRDFFIFEMCSGRSRYAWRKICENGTKYGVYPWKYETEDEYNEALRKAKVSF